MKWSTNFWCWRWRGKSITKAPIVNLHVSIASPTHPKPTQLHSAQIVSHSLCFRFFFFFLSWSPPPSMVVIVTTAPPSSLGSLQLLYRHHSFSSNIGFARPLSAKQSLTVVAIAPKTKVIYIVLAIFSHAQPSSLPCLTDIFLLNPMTKSSSSSCSRTITIFKASFLA